MSKPIQNGGSHGLRRTLSTAAAVMAGIITLVGSATVAFADTPGQRYGVVAGYNSTIAGKFSDLGIGLLRTPCNWADMEPSRGTYTWGCSDQRINDATGDGHQVLLTAQCTPTWARSSGDCNTEPTSMSDWYDFVAAFVAHYSGKQVVLGIYNEPDISTNGAAMSYSQYCDYAVWGMAGRDSVDTSFPLGMPETSDNAYSNGWFANAMSCITTNATLRSQDVITVHWYDGGPTFSSYIDYVHTYSGGANNVWLSETGYSSSNQFTQASFYGARLSDFEYLVLTRPWWKKIVFFSLYDAGNDLGIVNTDNSNRIAYAELKDVVALTTVPTMVANDYLLANSYVTSVGGDYHLVYQGDGNLVLYDSGWSYAGWNSATAGTSPGEAVLQGDGNLLFTMGAPFQCGIPGPQGTTAHI